MNRESTEIVLDAFGAVGTDLTQQLILDKVLRVPSPDTKLILRLMTHIAGMTKPPTQVKFMFLSFIQNEFS